MTSQELSHAVMPDPLPDPNSLASKAELASPESGERDDALLVRALSQQLYEQAKIIALREEAITWLQNELAIAQNEMRSVKGSKFWKLRDFYFRMRKLPADLRERLLEGRQGAGRASLFNRRIPDSLDFKPSSVRLVPDSPYASLKIQPTLPFENYVQLEHASNSFPTRGRGDIICFSIIDWSFRYQRPQHIMSQFAAHGHRVFYLNLCQFLAPNSTTRVQVRPLKENVFDVSLAAARPPQIYREVVEGVNLDVLMESLTVLREQFKIEQAMSYVMIASWGELALTARNRWGWRMVYDCMDEWENFPGVSGKLVKMEARVVQECDLLVVTATKLWNKWQALNRPMVLARNGVEYETYLSRLQPNTLLRDISHPVIGYFGAIADWFEVEWVVSAAQQRPLYTFILLGGIFDVDVSKLRALPNVRLLGQQPYETMPLYLYHFDVCIIPFKRNAITEATDPVKLYEYFSAGCPVVATDLPEIAPHRNLIYFARDTNQFVAQLDAAIAEADLSLAEARRQTARQNTWNTRYEQIAAGIELIVPRVSIVVVTFNNVALTRLCVESILGNTAYPNYELVLVDNHSTDATPEYLSALAAQYSHVRVLLNSTNRGFAAANNQGLEIASGEYLILLNNDTIVPSGWLECLVWHLGDARNGLVGPVTNFAGNEARLNVPYTTWSEMDAFARQRSNSFRHQSAEIPVLAMFCIAMRREVFRETGPLDEQFGIGMFEDDDYTMRVRQNGYRIVCALDTFVHHFGQAAFRQLIREGSYDALFDANRRRYEAKWHVEWIPHRHGQLEAEC